MKKYALVERKNIPLICITLFILLFREKQPKSKKEPPRWRHFPSLLYHIQHLYFGVEHGVSVVKEMIYLDAVVRTSDAMGQKCICKISSSTPKFVRLERCNFIIVNEWIPIMVREVVWFDHTTNNEQITDARICRLIKSDT